MYIERKKTHEKMERFYVKKKNKQIEMGKKVADKKMWHEDMRLNEIEQKK